MKLPTALTSTAFGFHPVHGADGASRLVLIISAIDPTTTIRPENGAFYDASTALNTRREVSALFLFSAPTLLPYRMNVMD